MSYDSMHIDELSGRPLLSWVSYPQGDNTRSFYVYPQLELSVDGGRQIDNSAFPDRGCVGVAIQGGYTASDIRERYGDVVVMTLQTSTGDSILNDSYPYDSEDRYFTRFNPQYSQYGYSTLKMSRLSQDSIAKDYVQIIAVDPEVDLSQPTSEPIALAEDGVEPQSKIVILEQVQGLQVHYYGPFEVLSYEQLSVSVSAVDDFRKHIFKMTAAEIGDIIKIQRPFNRFSNAIKFIEISTLRGMFRSRGVARMIDWISDEELLDALLKLVKIKLNLRPTDITAVKQAIKSCNMGDSGIYVTEERKRRMTQLFESPLQRESYADLIAEGLARPQAQDALVRVALSPAHIDSVIKVLVDEAQIKEAIQDERRRLEKDLDPLRNLKGTLEQEIGELKTRKDKLEKEALGDIRAEIERLTAEKESYELENDRLRVENERARAERAEVDEGIDELVGRIGAKADETAAKLVESRVFGAIAGIGTGVRRSSVDQEAPVRRPIPEIREDEDEWEPERIVSEIKDLASKKGDRNLAEDAVINLMCCLMGANMTVLSGTPGSGKTSLAGILAGSLGLCRPREERFRKIMVERGWTSHRDYIGYYNPLTQRIEAADPDLLQDIFALGDEDDFPTKRVPYLFLLDEANLSVMENYWSPFLGNADDFMERPTELGMQGGNPLVVPTNTRWISTINFDHTTEALSKRFLNRAWVVSVENGNLDIDDLLTSPEKDGFADVRPFSYEKLVEAFGPRSEITSGSIPPKSLIRSFFDTCKKYGDPVSYRCQRAVLNYIATASPIMGEFGTAGGVRAADYALSQRVLPSISGTTEQVRDLLSSLRQVSSQLPLTRTRIEKMLEAGDTDGFYQFFV